MRLGTTSLSVTRPGSKRRPVAAVPAATYSLSSAGSVNEGENMTVTVTTTNVSDSTVLYWSTSNITTSDPDFTATTGTTTITNNSGSFSVAAVADSTTEGAETFGITLRTGSQSGPIVASTTNKTINDTSQTPPPPSYSASSSSSINEGSALGVTVTTTNVADSTTLYWTTNHTTTSTADFSSNSGSFTITSNSGTFNVPVVADSATEGAETFTVEIRTTSTSGTIVATLPSVTVNDTSTASTYSFSSASEVDEGSALGCTVTTTGVSNGTTLYWTIGHTTTTAADFTNTSGSFTVNSNSGTFSIAIANDTNNENAETFTVQIRTNSTSGTVVETSNSVTLNNIYFDDVANYSFLRTDPLLGASGHNPQSIRFKPDGTKVFILEGSLASKPLRQYTLSTPFDISTHSSTYVTLSTYDSSDTSFQGGVTLDFKPDGTEMWLGDFYGMIRHYNLSTAWDISTASFSGDDWNSLNGTGGTRLTSMQWARDGDYLYTTDPNTDKVWRHAFNTAYDITSSYVSTSGGQMTSSTNTVENIPRGVFISSDGKKAYVSGNRLDEILMYDLSTAWDITGVSSTPDSTLAFGQSEGSSSDITFSTNGKFMYISGLTTDTIIQYER